MSTVPLTIFLIKDAFTTSKDIVLPDIHSIELDGGGLLFFKDSDSNRPKWLTLFGADAPLSLFSSNASALYLAKVNDRYFAVTFGPSGRHFLIKGVWEERFGLLVTLNSILPSSLRSVDTRALESEGLQTRIQSSRPNSADQFGFDIERDLVRNVAGVSKDVSKYGSSISGKDSLHVSINCDLASLNGYLEGFLYQFQSKEYQQQFAWIDKSKEVSDAQKIVELDNFLITAFNADGSEKLWLALPAILDWGDHGGFKYSSRKSDILLDDIDVKSFKDSMNGQKITLDLIKSSDVYRFSASNEYQKDHWKLYECIYFEHSNGNETYILTDGKWYEIANSLVGQVNQFYGSLPTSCDGITFINYDHNDENEYNKTLASETSSICLDKNLIKVDGRSNFEFCDVYTKNKQMLHIKLYSGSATLSHLFNQGFVSANFLLDRDFRERISQKLPSDYAIDALDDRPNAKKVGEYSVVFGVISRSNKPLDLPFFSKLTLMHVAKDLHNLGFDVYLVKIQNVKQYQKK